jgi:glycosyltransferase involved in cell wall biosynthesis
VYPSLYEGFGLPLLEAMQRGVPVLSSRSTSLPEVGGEAVDYVDAADPAALAAALLRLARDPGRRAALARAGALQAERFSWRRTARETLAVHESVARR